MSEKIALVTGASRGIGKAILLKLAQDGFQVIGTATSEAGVNTILQTLKEHNLSGHALVLNTADSNSVEALVKTITSDFGPVQVLVNNAGIADDQLLMRMKDDAWDKVINTNLTGVYRLSKAFTRGMLKAKWGRIINISSVVALMGNAGSSNYVAAKAGVLGFTKSIARELASRNITVNAVAPGFIETDMTATLPDSHKEAMLSQIPIGRMGSAMDIAAAVSFLASENASYITGETLNVNGGMYM